MKTFLRTLWDDDSGISSVEYALLLSMVAAAVIVAANQLADSVSLAMCESAQILDGNITCP